MRKLVSLIVAATAVGVVFVGMSAAGPERADPQAGAPVLPARQAGDSPGAVMSGRLAGASLESTIDNLQAHLDSTPNDDVSWATLGLAYVQQARITVNPDFYPRAEGALERSFEINATDNFLGYAGRSALAAARHDFVAAKDLAQEGLEINSYSPLLYGALSDALLQLGDYDAAFAAIQRMVDLSPDTSSLTRASYAWELRGDTARATELMQRAYDDAPTAADRAFTLHLLGDLAFDGGDPALALEHSNAALEASPDDAASRFGQARAEAALGQTDAALAHYADLVRAVPEPGYLVAYGRLLEAEQRNDEADAQYAVVSATRALFTANGVLPDADAVLFEVDHGDPEQAVRDARLGLQTRPFLAMHDALAWALHSTGRDDEALVEIEAALALDTPNALYRYHAGVIRNALGDPDGARVDLAAALEINPHFDPLSAPLARQLLAELDAEAEAAG